MTEFDEDRLPGLRRLHSLLVSDPSLTIKAKQFDAYLTWEERQQWRAQLAEYEDIKRAGVEAQITGEAASYWATLRHLYATKSRMRTAQQEREFQTALEELWEQFEQLGSEATAQLREATGSDARWNNIPSALEYEFHIINDGSYFQPWWDYPLNFTQRELAASVIDKLDPSPAVANSLPSGFLRLRQLSARLNR